MRQFTKHYGLETQSYASQNKQQKFNVFHNLFLTWADFF